VNELSRQTTTQENSAKALLAVEGASIRSAHFVGASGAEVVERRTALIDRVLSDGYAQVAAAGTMPALLAIGGYGRGELNPYSDIDIMFLCRDNTDRQRAPQLLYLLWDAGLDVGYSVRTIKDCVSLAQQDIKIRTSLLESRLIAGDTSLYDSFLNAMRSEAFYWKATSFITEKISERVATRQKFGGSIYLREPNIKECEGGLRDFHTALWIAFVHYRISSFSQLVTQGIITEVQYARFLRSRSFLWRLRNEIHYLSDRKNDHLTFDLQERTAKDFHYRNSTHLLAVERFMKSYFLHARNIREFSNLVIDTALRKPSRRWFERTLSLGPFKLVGRTLVLASDDVSRNNAPLIMTAFEIAQSRHATISDHLQAMIRGAVVSDEERTSAAVSQAFRSILNNPDGLSETLTLMKDLRFLGKYLPEFRSIEALAKHDYYHLYTVDEHILLAIKNLQNLWTGSYPGHATLVEAYRSLKKRWVLNLAVLLHDLGKVYRRDHEYRGVDLAKTILARLGITGEDQEYILFLIKNHLIMTTLSQRRELTDQNVIARFSRLVRNRENLIMLYLLTFADVSAVNPSSWTQWKAALLQDLYERTLSYIDASAQVEEEERARILAAVSRIRDSAARLFSTEEIDVFLASMPEQYILYTPTDGVVEHMDMVQKLPQEHLVIRHQHYPEKGYTELTVCAYDAYGMFYRTAGTIAAKNLNILSAQVYTSKNGVMLDTFQITDPEGNLYNYELAWQSVLAELKTALMSKSKPPEPGLYVTNKPFSSVITPAVEFDNETSVSFTIIDITGRDRVGFLYQVSKALYDLNLDIGSAKIVTEGARAMDSFYVTDLLRNKINDDERLKKIMDVLLKVLD
jgi:[protein-PII] uridylyltransferase